MSHTPGPWEWVNGLKHFYLATPDRGRLIVMDFVRMGTGGAQPRFAVWDGEHRERLGGLMVKAQDLVVEDHPDARLIAAAPDLLAALKRYMHAYQRYMDGQENANEISAAEAEARRAVTKAEGSSLKENIQ